MRCCVVERFEAMRQNERVLLLPGEEVELIEPHCGRNFDQCMIHLDDEVPFAVPRLRLSGSRKLPIFVVHVVLTPKRFEMKNPQFDTRQIFLGIPLISGEFEVAIQKWAYFYLPAINSFTPMPGASCF